MNPIYFGCIVGAAFLLGALVMAWMMREWSPPKKDK